MDKPNGPTQAHDEPAPRRDHRGAPPTPNAWYHVTFSTYGAWIRGDERGFRDHGHRIHSSGDYKNPPPASEHAGLRRWVKLVMNKEPVLLTPPQRRTAGLSLRDALQGQHVELLALAVGGEHVHILGRFRADHARATIGTVKRVASLQMRDAIPGALWAKRCHLRQIRDREHQHHAYHYICDHITEGAWVWNYREGEISPR